MAMGTENRKHKDSLFVDLFYEDESAKKNLLSLYNALHDTEYQDEGIIRKVRVGDVLYKNFKNDISFEADGRVLVLGEHQSTVNPNMPLRCLMYVGAKSTVSVAISCACVGIIVGVCSQTGFALNIASAIISIGRNAFPTIPALSLFLTLLFTMVTCMILGMGLPSIPSYLITATIAAPALIHLGVPDLAAHMFCFYFADRKSVV